jgi:hypothetical protein
LLRNAPGAVGEPFGGHEVSIPCNIMGRLIGRFALAPFRGQKIFKGGSRLTHGGLLVVQNVRDG